MPSRKLEDLCPEMLQLYMAFKRKVQETPGAPAYIVTCTYRSMAEQAECVKQGTSKIFKGNHNWVDKNGKPASRAFDVAVMIDGKPLWNPTLDADKDGVPEYTELGRIGESVGLVWGGCRTGKWKNFVDAPHFELPNQK